MKPVRNQIIRVCTIGVLFLFCTAMVGYGDMNPTLYTPEASGAKADDGYFLHWYDEDSAGAFLSLYYFRLDQMYDSNSVKINHEPIPAAESGFAGNTYFWDTHRMPEGDYRLWIQRISSDGTTGRADTADGLLRIRHDKPHNPDQTIYLYSFMHCKNQFIMHSQAAEFEELLATLSRKEYKKFEITLQWPMAYFLQHGKPSGQQPGTWLFPPAPGILEKLKKFQNTGGSIGYYTPLSGWHYRNLVFEFPELVDNWHGLGKKAIKYDVLFQNQTTGDLRPGRAGSKYYLDSVFDAPTITLAGNLPTVAYHIVGLMGNTILAQHRPDAVAGYPESRFIDGRDYYAGSPFFWYLNQLSFSHYNHRINHIEAVSPLGNHPFERQIPLVGLVNDSNGLYFSDSGVPIDNKEYQSFQEAFDGALKDITENEIDHDLMYVFDHDHSLQHLFDSTAESFREAISRRFPQLGQWTINRMLHMNSAPKIAAGQLPRTCDDWQFRERYRTSAKRREMIYHMTSCALDYVQFMAKRRPNIHLITGDELPDLMVSPPDVLGDSVVIAAARFIKKSLHWYGDGHAKYGRLPAYVTLSPELLPSTYLSLAETFIVCAQTLSRFAESGEFPRNVALPPAVGPATLTDDLSRLTPCSIPVEAILRALGDLNLTDPLGDKSLWPFNMEIRESCQVPSYIDLLIPDTSSVIEKQTNAAEFLYLMACAIDTIAGNPDTGGKLIKAMPLRPLNEWVYTIQSRDGNYDSSQVNTYTSYDDDDNPVTYYFNHIQMWTFKPGVVRKEVSPEVESLEKNDLQNSRLTMHDRQLTFELKYPGPVSIKAFTLGGRLVHHAEMNVASGGPYTFAIADLLPATIVAGAYLFEVQTGGASLHGKFVVAQ